MNMKPSSTTNTQQTAKEFAGEGGGSYNGFIQTSKPLFGAGAGGPNLFPRGSLPRQPSLNAAPLSWLLLPAWR